MTAFTSLIKHPRSVGYPVPAWTWAHRDIRFLAKFDERGSGDPAPAPVFPADSLKTKPRDSISGKDALIFDLNLAIPDPQHGEGDHGYHYRFTTDNAALFGTGVYWEGLGLQNPVDGYTIALTFQNMDGGNFLQRMVEIGSTYLSIQPVTRTIFMNPGLDHRP